MCQKYFGRVATCLKVFLLCILWVLARKSIMSCFLTALYRQQLDRLKEANTQQRSMGGELCVRTTPGHTHRRRVLCIHLIVRTWHQLINTFFLPMANDFASEKLASREVTENRICRFFAHRHEGFYKKGTMKLLKNFLLILTCDGSVWLALSHLN